MIYSFTLNRCSCEN